MQLIDHLLKAVGVGFNNGEGVTKAIDKLVKTQVYKEKNPGDGVTYNLKRDNINYEFDELYDGISFLFIPSVNNTTDTISLKLPKMHSVEVYGTPTIVAGSLYMAILEGDKFKLFNLTSTTNNNSGDASGGNDAGNNGAGEDNNGTTPVDPWTYLTLTDDHEASGLDFLALNTENGSFVITLPTTPDDFTRIRFLDVGNNLETNPVTINPNNEIIMGADTDIILDSNGVSLEIIYANKEWRVM